MYKFKSSGKFIASYNLGEKARQKKEQLARAMALGQQQEQLQDEIQNLSRNELRTVEVNAKENIQNEAKAMKKAEELARENEKKRREAQKTVQDLVGQEQEARKKAQQVGQNVSVTVEQRPATVDVFEHRRYETTEPVVKAEVATDKGDEKESHGLVDKIKSLF